MAKKEIIVMICIATFFTAFILVFILLPNGEERAHAKRQSIKPSRNMGKTITQNLNINNKLEHYQTLKGLECVVYGSMSGGVGISCNWAVYNTPQNYDRKN